VCFAVDGAKISKPACTKRKKIAAIAECYRREKKKAGRRTRPTLKISMKKLYINKVENMILFCCNK
jgi:hypothetical protein